VQLVVRREARVDHGDRDRCEQRREEAQGASDIEEAEFDPSVPLVLLDEQRRDQEAGDDEEDLHADEAAAERLLARERADVKTSTVRIARARRPSRPGR
jgi:hypothetical protein